MILLEYGSPEDAHGRAQHMLMSTIPVPAVVVAADDVIAVMTIALASARFLGDRSQGRIVSVPKELMLRRSAESSASVGTDCGQ